MEYETWVFTEKKRNLLGFSEQTEDEMPADWVSNKKNLQYGQMQFIVDEVATCVSQLQL